MNNWIKVLIVGAVGGLAGFGANSLMKKGSSSYDTDGYDDEGYDRQGYDRDGYDRNGLDRMRRDRDGFNIHGYDGEGFNREGIDRLGFDRLGYNADGVDRAGCHPEHCIKEAAKIESLANKAHDQMKQGELPYAFRDIRVGLEIAAKCIVEHWEGPKALEGKLSNDIERCRKRLGNEMTNKARGAARHCNAEVHYNDTPGKEKTYDQAHFCHKTLLELKAVVESLAKG